jgi:hypothetical protein
MTTSLSLPEGCCVRDTTRTCHLGSAKRPTWASLLVGQQTPLTPDTWAPYRRDGKPAERLPYTMTNQGLHIYTEADVLNDVDRSHSLRLRCYEMRRTKPSTGHRSYLKYGPIALNLRLEIRGESKYWQRIDPYTFDYELIFQKPGNAPLVGIYIRQEGCRQQ